MAFNVKHNLFSLLRVHSVKQWGPGWTVSEAARAATHHGGTEPSQLPQYSRPYTLLVGFGHRERNWR